ncbi:MAG: putative 4-hydroxybenzoate polyprenyltransferase, partial [Blastocatellia bacterium]|nr:putative 4-hydroxybenzoate polyprenyltransferase [Blastocatellia bacterium]
AYDARNPRTAQRPLVTGQISLRTAWGGTLVAAALLTLAAWRLGPLPFRLLPGALLALFGYSLTKRFTWLSHFILGMTDGLAPLGAWVAVRGTLFSAADAPAWLLWLTVTLWIGGFDMIYACQDVDFDRAARLYAIPARYGVATALRVARLTHLALFIPLFLLGKVAMLGNLFTLGLVPIALLLVYEHAIVSPNDLSRVNVAFFNVNSIISIVLLSMIVLSVIVH